MPEKLLSSSSSSSPGILQMQQTTREKRKTVNVTWLCCAIALIVLVLLGFAFLLRNFFGRWPAVNTAFLGSSSKSNLPEDILPIYQHISNGHSYDTNIPPSGVPTEPEIITKPSTIEDRDRDKLFSENAQVKMAIVRRSQWGAHAAKRKIYFKTFALDRVIVLETGTEFCYDADACSQAVRNIQKSDLKTASLDDIRYNFLIGGDGSVFEGRGFNGIGEHTPNYNNASLGIAMIGRFEETPPTEQQVVSLRKLLQYGIAWEYLKSNYELFGYDQLVGNGQGPANNPGTTAANPGIKLFSIIRKWPHWTENNFYKTE